MNTKGQVVVGIVLVVAGLLAFLDTLLGISLWAFAFPLALIALGAWVILRPSRVAAGTRISQQIFGDVVRKGPVADEDVFVLLGDVKIDWRGAPWPAEPVHLNVTGLLGDVRIRVPSDVAVSLESRAAISSLRLDGQKQDAFFAPVELCSAGFAESDQRLYVTVAHLLGDVRIERDAASQESARPWD